NGFLARDRFKPALSRVEASEGRSEGDSLWVKVNAQDVASRRVRDLDRQQSQKAETDHRHILANLWFGEAKSVHGNCAERGKGRRFKIHTLRKRREQVARHDRIFCVDRLTSARAGHALTDLEALHVRAERNDGSRR